MIFSQTLIETCMYTDAACNPLTKCAGFGWIIDDAWSSSSHSVASFFVTSLFIAETSAMQNAMIYAFNREIKALSIFSDSQILINLVRSKEKHLEIAEIYNDIYLFFPYIYCYLV